MLKNPAEDSSKSSFFFLPPPKKRTWRDDKARHEHQKAIKAKLLSVGAADSSQTWARRHTHCRLTLRAVQCNAMQTFLLATTGQGDAFPFALRPLEPRNTCGRCSHSPCLERTKRVTANAISGIAQKDGSSPEPSKRLPQNSHL